MKFRKRLSAAILAIVMMVSSIQIPGGTSYAAEMEGGSIESEQEVLIPAEEEAEGSGIESEQEVLISAEEEVEDSSETVNYEGEVLVEKEVKASGQNFENLDYTFKTTDDQTVSSKADGRPKVLIFFRATVFCVDSITTLGRIGNSIDEFDGVDIYAIETEGATKDEVITFKNKYLGAGITYCYDLHDPEWPDSETESGWAMWKYYWKFVPSANEVSFPAIFYIDAENRLQHYTTGAKNPEDVLDDLKNYCNYTKPEIYNITYVMNGGVNKESNPDSYSYSPDSGEDIVLARPYYREGYKFEGWYSDKEYTELVTSIPAGSRSDITLYAKWSERKGGFELENLEQSYLPLNSDAEMTSAADGKPKLLVFYGNDVNGTPEVLSEITEALSSEPEHDLNGVDIYAIATDNPWGGSEKEAIEADQKAVSDKIAFSYDESGSNWGKMVEYAKAVDYWGYGNNMELRPIICYIDAQNNFQYLSIQEQTVEQVMSNLSAYCNYPAQEDVETYSITYILDDGENDEGNPDTYTEKTETIVLKAAVKEGYTFGGWYKDAEYKEEVTEIASGSTGDITLYAKWIKADAGANLGNLDYTFTTIDDKTVSSKADGKPKVLFFFNTGCWNCQQTNINLSEHIDEFDGIDIYAIEIENKTKDEVSAFKDTYGCDGITYSYDTGLTNHQAMWNYYRKFDASATTVTTPVIIFIDAENRLQHVSTGLRGWSDILGDLQKYCNYSPKEDGKTYNISYVLDGGTNDSSNPSTYTAQTETITLKAATKEGYTFDGWYRDPEFKEAVTEIASGNRGDIILFAKWIKVSEEQGKENPEYIFTTIDDQTVSSKADGKPKVLFFLKTDCTNCQQTNISLREHISKFTDIDIYAIGSNQETKDEISNFKSEYGCDGITYCYDTGWTSNQAMWDYYGQFYTGGTTYIITPVIVYIDAENHLQHITTGFRSWSNILDNLKEYCNYMPPERVETYNITYVLDGGTNDSGNPDTYTEQTETITLKAAVKDDYIFDGWYMDAEFKEIVTKIVKGSTGNITLYAKWIPLTQADDRIDLAEVGVNIANIKAKVYDALEYEPALKVTVKVMVNGKQKTQTLVEGADYIVEYENNVEAGIGTAYIKGNGMYKGEYSKTFTINPKPVKKLKVITGNVAGNVSEASIGNKSAELPVYVYDGRKLLTGADYSLEVKQSNEKAVTVEITAKEGSNYTGSRTVKLTVYNSVSEENVINPENIFIDGKTFIEEYETEYTGKAIKPEVAVRIGSTTLTNKDYKVAYQNNKDAGTAYVIVTGKGDYKGKVVVPFSIVPVSPVLTITNTIKDKTYNGKLQKPAVKVKAGKVTLKNNKDYKVTYTENLYAGTATITVNGRGNYTGGTYTTFLINKQNIKKVSVKGTQSEGLSVYYGTRLLIRNRDYTLEYGNTKGKNKIEVIITATEDSDFSGSVTKSVKIQ